MKKTCEENVTSPSCTGIKFASCIICLLLKKILSKLNLTVLVHLPYKSCKLVTQAD
jgi:hypothetical protein